MAITTAQEALDYCRENGTAGCRYELDLDNLAVGGWYEAEKRFVPVMLKAFDGQWVLMPYELQINGKPAIPAEKWPQ